MTVAEEYEPGMHAAAVMKPWLVAAVGALAVSMMEGRACPVCFPFPKESSADHLIAADVVVLAREDPERPFHLRAVEVLKGSPGDEGIDLFLDTLTRRLLSLHPEWAVVCTYHGDGPGAWWRRVGVADGEVGPVVREILARAPGWEGAPEDRCLFFADYLTHGNEQLRGLAHIEMARAPYSEIRKIGKTLPPERIRAFLARLRYLEWHSLYILFLAQTGNGGDQSRIRESMRNASRFSMTSLLAAWATALVEVDGEEGLAFLREQYIENRDRDPAEMREIQMALSVHGTNGRTDLRERIVQDYGRMLERHPAMAARVVADLSKWKRVDHVGMVAGILAADPGGLDRGTVQQLRNYVRLAGNGTPGELHPTDRSVVAVAVFAMLVLLPIGLGVAAWSRRRRGRPGSRLT